MWVLGGFWSCVAIAIAAAIRRLPALIHPSQSVPPAVAWLNDFFSSHAALTALHIMPAAIFVLLSAFVLLSNTRHRWLESLFFWFGAITGLTAYAMSSHSVGGWLERSAVLVFNTWFMFSLGRALWFRLHNQPLEKARVDDPRGRNLAWYRNDSPHHLSLLRY